MSETPANRGRRRVVFTLIAIILAVAGGAWWLTRPSPQKLFEQGLVAGRKDQAASERLLKRAIQTAGGRYPDAQIALCHSLSRRGAWDEALSLLKSIDTADCRADLLLDFGRDALQAGHRTEGLQVLHAAARQGAPASVAALDLLIEDYYEWGQQNEQAQAARELTRLEPDNPQQWMKLVTILNSMNLVNEAVTALREAIQQDFAPEYRQEFQYMLASAMLEQGRIDDAWREFAEWKLTAGESFRAQVFEMGLHRLQGHPELALKLLGAQTSSPEDLPTLLLVRSAVYLDLRRYDEAARDLERVLAVRPNDANAHSKLSAALRGLRRDEDAARHATIASEIIAKRLRIKVLLKQRTQDSHNERIYEELADAYRDLGENESAARWRQRAARLRAASSPGNPRGS